MLPKGNPGFSQLYFIRGMMENKITILLVDDEAIVGNRLMPALTKIGCEVEVFRDSKMAMQRINEKIFDIIISDIMMPEVNGIQLLEFAKANSARSRVIMITGYASESLAREAMSKGAFDIIAKPFRPGDLRVMIAKAAEALGVSERLIPFEQV